MLFSDECDLFPKKHGKRRIRKYKGEEVDVYLGPDCRWDSRTVKVWGVIGSDEVGPLIRYDGTLNAERYIEILDRYLVPAYPQLQRRGGVTFIDDGASPHKAVMTKGTMTTTCITYDYHRRALN